MVGCSSVCDHKGGRQSRQYRPESRRGRQPARGRGGRVRLKRVTCDIATICPLEGEGSVVAAVTGGTGHGVEWSRENWDSQRLHDARERHLGGRSQRCICLHRGLKWRLPWRCKWHECTRLRCSLWKTAHPVGGDRRTAALSSAASKQMNTSAVKIGTCVDRETEACRQFVSSESG